MKPLADTLVLDLSRVLAGPFCTMRLADLGARVIKVESIKGDTTRYFGPPFVGEESPYFMSFNRGKESIVLDLKSQDGIEFVKRVLESADVLIENFRPQVMERLGLGDSFLAEKFPQLIRVGITGFGPESDRYAEPAFDLAIQAESGLMAMNGNPGEAQARVPISIADLAAGSAASEATLAALFARERTGKSCRIEISLLDSLVALFGYQAQSTLLTGIDPEKMGHRHPNLAPYQAFETADVPLVLAIAMEPQWQRFIRMPGVPSQLANEAWQTNAERVQDRVRLESCLNNLFVERPRDEWLDALRLADVPASPVKTVSEMLADYRARKSTFLKDYQHQTIGPLLMPTSPFLWQDGKRSRAALAPPTLGQHTSQLLREFAEDEEEALRWLANIQGDRT